MKIQIKDEGELLISLTQAEARILIEEIGDLPNRVLQPKLRQFYSEAFSVLTLVSAGQVRTRRAIIGDRVRAKLTLVQARVRAIDSERESESESEREREKSENEDMAIRRGGD